MLLSITNGMKCLYTELYRKMKFFKSTDATGDQYVCEFAGSENVAVGKKNHKDNRDLFSR